MIFYGSFGPHNYVSMKKRGTCGTAPRICGAHFKGSIILRGALWRLQNSGGQKLTANLPRGVLEPSKCAPQNYGVIFVNHCRFRDLYNQYEFFKKKNISRDGTFKPWTKTRSPPQKLEKGLRSVSYFLVTLNPSSPDPFGNRVKVRCPI